MITNEQRTAVLAALAELGFVNGMYGEVPYTVEWDDLTSGQDTSPTGGWAVIMSGGRAMGYASVMIDGTITPHINIAGWMHPNSKPTHFTYEDIGLSTYNGAGIVKINLKDDTKLEEGD